MGEPSRAELLSELESLQTLVHTTRTFLHEINNLIHLGWGSAEALQRKPERASEWLEVLHKTMKRGRNTVTAFQPFVRSVWPERARAELGVLLSAACELLGPTFPRLLQVGIDPRPIRVELVFTDFLHALHCLMQESSDCMPETHDALQIELSWRAERAGVLVRLPQGAQLPPGFSPRLQRAVERLGARLGVCEDTAFLMELAGTLVPERERLVLLVEGPGQGSSLRALLESNGFAVLMAREGESVAEVLGDYVDELDALVLRAGSSEQATMPEQQADWAALQVLHAGRESGLRLIWAGATQSLPKAGWRGRWQWVENRDEAILSALLGEAADAPPSGAPADAGLRETNRPC